MVVVVVEWRAARAFPRCAVSFKWMDASGNIYISIYISCGADWSHPFECPGFDYRRVSPRWRGSFSRCLLKSSEEGEEGGSFSGSIYPDARKFRSFEEVATPPTFSSHRKISGRKI